MKPEARAGIPELSVSVLTAITKYLPIYKGARLLVVESEMIAIQKGIMEKNDKLTPAKIVGVYKDIINRLDETANFFEDGLNGLTSSAKSNFKRYYILFCHAMTACYEVLPLL